MLNGRLKVEKGVRVFVHNRINDNELNELTKQINQQRLNDKRYVGVARVLASYNDTCICYRVNNELYFIPATIHAIACEDKTIRTWYSYPCEMKVSDLKEID